MAAVAGVVGMLEAVLFRLVAHAGGRLELVGIAARDGDPEFPREVWHAWRTADDLQGGWDTLGWRDLAPRRSPAVVANADERLEIVVVGDELWHVWQRRPGGDWSGWHSLGAPPVAGPVMGGSGLARNQDGRLELFTKAGDGTLWHRWQTGPGRGPWHDWHSLGEPGGLGFGTPDAPPAVASNHDGRLELFVHAGDGTVAHRWQTRPNGGWSAWSSLEAPAPGVAGEPVVARNQDGRLELFTAAADGSVWHRWQAGPGRGPWRPWAPLGQVTTVTASDMLAAGAHADGRLVLLAIATTADDSREVWRREQSAPNDGWSPWESLGRPDHIFPVSELSKGLDRIGPPALVPDGQGRLLLWSLIPVPFGSSTKLYVLEQAAPSAAEWRPGIRAFSNPPVLAYTPEPASAAPPAPA